MTEIALKTNFDQIPNLGTAARIRGGLERATTFVTLINAPIRLFAYLVGADCNRCRTLRRRN
jgi:hypothetical protein